MYSEVSNEGLSELKLNTTQIRFVDNKALSGNSAYLDIPSSCDEACLNRRSIVGVNKGTLKHGHLAGHIRTPPNKLALYPPAVCVDDNVMNCGTHFVNNIMLGQEIIIFACVLWTIMIDLLLKHNFWWTVTI